MSNQFNTFQYSELSVLCWSILGLCWAFVGSLYAYHVAISGVFLWATHEQSMRSQSTIISAANHCADQTFFFIWFVLLPKNSETHIDFGGWRVTPKFSLITPKFSLDTPKFSPVTVQSRSSHGPTTFILLCFVFFFRIKGFSKLFDKVRTMYEFAPRVVQTQAVSLESLGFPSKTIKKVQQSPKMAQHNTLNSEYWNELKWFDMLKLCVYIHLFLFEKNRFIKKWHSI